VESDLRCKPPPSPNSALGGSLRNAPRVRTPFRPGSCTRTPSSRSIRLPVPALSQREDMSRTKPQCPGGQGWVAELPEPNIPYLDHDEEWPRHNGRRTSQVRPLSLFTYLRAAYIVPEYQRFTRAARYCCPIVRRDSLHCCAVSRLPIPWITCDHPIRIQSVKVTFCSLVLGHSSLATMAACTRHASRSGRTSRITGPARRPCRGRPNSAAPAPVHAIVRPRLRLGAYLAELLRVLTTASRPSRLVRQSLLCSPSY
jgi:hypothetical protein